MSLTPRSEALPLHKLYACVSSNSLSDSSETTSQSLNGMFILSVALLSTNKQGDQEVVDCMIQDTCYTEEYQRTSCLAWAL